MTFRIINKETYTQFFNETFYPVHYQDPAWLDCVKLTRSGDDYYGVYDEKETLFGVMIGTKRRIGGYGKIPFVSKYEFVSRRGVVMAYTEENIAKLTQAATRYMKAEKVLFVNITPNVAIEETGCQLPVDLDLQRKFTAAGWSETEYLYFDGRIPNYECIVNLHHDTFAPIEKSFKKGTMYEVKKARKMGVRVSKQAELDIDAYYRLFEETGQRAQFDIQPRAFYEMLFESFGDRAVFYTTEIHLPSYLQFVEENRSEKVELMEKIREDIKEYGEYRTLGVALVVNSQTMAFWESGATTNDYRETSANYLLQYEAILDAYNSGMKMYNFGSVSGDFSPENHLYGLYSFKSRFSGEPVHYIGELEIFVNSFEEKMYKRMKNMLKNKKK